MHSSLITSPGRGVLGFTFLVILICSSLESSTAFQASNTGLAPRIRPNTGTAAAPIRIKMSNSKEDNYDLKSITLGGDREFWTQQKELAEAMVEKDERTLKEQQMQKYQERANLLVGDTAFFTFLIFPVLWLCFDNPLFSLSYLLGATFGLAYCYALGKSVANLGGSVDDLDALQGAGVGEARFAFLILLFIFVGKFRSEGLVEIPCIGGFFTYQLASLSQGLKEFND